MRLATNVRACGADRPRFINGVRRASRGGVARGVCLATPSAAALRSAPPSPTTWASRPVLQITRSGRFWSMGCSIATIRGERSAARAPRSDCRTAGQRQERRRVAAFDAATEPPVDRNTPDSSRLRLRYALRCGRIFSSASTIWSCGRPQSRRKRGRTLTSGYY